MRSGNVVTRELPVTAVLALLHTPQRPPTDHVPFVDECSRTSHSDSLEKNTARSIRSFSVPPSLPAPASYVGPFPARSPRRQRRFRAGPSNPSRPLAPCYFVGHVPSRVERSRRPAGGGCRPRNRASPSAPTVLRGWFDGLGGGDPSGDKRKVSPGGDDAKRKGRPVAGGQAARGRETRDSGGAGSSGAKGVSRIGGAGDRGVNKATGQRPRGGKEGKGLEGAGDGDAEGVNMVASARAFAYAASDVVSSTVEGFQERFSQVFPRNVTLFWGGGESTEVTVPWRGIGLYAGGLVSGVALSFALLTLPYADLGSPGLRKALTLFENVLLDIDQVRRVPSTCPSAGGVLIECVSPWEGLPPPIARLRRRSARDWPLGWPLLRLLQGAAQEWVPPTLRMSPVGDRVSLGCGQGFPLTWLWFMTTCSSREFSGISLYSRF